MKYIHRVNYYETDRMGVTHHSNYIRFMEEARAAFLDEIGFSYQRLEEMGIVSPVIGVSCKYHKSTTFADRIEIEVKIKAYNGIKLEVEYKMYNFDTRELVLTGSSEHCFLTKEGKPLRLVSACKELDLKLKECNKE